MFLATIGVMAVLTAGWLAGAGTAGSPASARPETATVVSTAIQTVTVDHTVTVAAPRRTRRAHEARNRRTGHPGGAKHKHRR